jgi:hypothetical protein
MGRGKSVSTSPDAMRKRSVGVCIFLARNDPRFHGVLMFLFVEMIRHKDRTTSMSAEAVTILTYNLSDLVSILGRDFEYRLDYPGFKLFQVTVSSNIGLNSNVKRFSGLSQAIPFKYLDGASK